MARDLREMFEEHKVEAYLMKGGHRKRFIERLNEEFPKKKLSFLNLRIAAAILIMVSLGFYFFSTDSSEERIKTTIVDSDNSRNDETKISLGTLSPDLKKVENYYVASIGMVLSELDISDSNKALVDSFMERLSELNTEYEKLNKELNDVGPNDQTISALIKNLQLRLQLLQKLKIKLNELKSSKNESVRTNFI